MALVSNDSHDTAADSPANRRKIAVQDDSAFGDRVGEGQTIGRTGNGVCPPDSFSAAR